MLEGGDERDNLSRSPPCSPEEKEIEADACNDGESYRRARLVSRDQERDQIRDSSDSNYNDRRKKYLLPKGGE
ncbi:MAG: hypothetical protein RIQ56_96 [Candidatus Parcubacteria bacterium]